MAEASPSWCIYTLSDPESSLVRYVGFTVNLSKRIRRHIQEASSGQDKGSKGTWLRDLRARNLEPTVAIVEVSGARAWQDAEKYWIAHFRDAGMPLLNIAPGGTGPALGYSPTEEHRRNLSRALKGKKKTAEAIKASSEAHKGKPMGAAQRKALLQWSIGHTVTPEMRTKIGAAHRGKIVSEETRQKLRGRRHPRSPETRAKIAAALTGRTRTKQERANMSAGIKAAFKAHPEIVERIAALSRIRNPPSSETRHKMSASHIGLRPSLETRAKMSASHRARPPRPPNPLKQVARELRAEGLLYREIGSQLGVPKITVYTWINGRTNRAT